jgi:hypothetical protein
VFWRGNLPSLPLWLAGVYISSPKTPQHDGSERHSIVS